MRIDRLLLSEVTLPDQHPRAGDPCPVFGYLILHPDGPVLVDTGVGTGHEDIDRLFAPVHHSIDTALATSEVERRDVIMVINSHLHFDHCGLNLVFPGVPLVAQRTEYTQAHQPGYTITEWVDFPGARWEPVDGVTEVLPGVTVLPTAGHTPGHQSVVVTDEVGLDVIAAQAVYDPDELDAEASIEALPADEAEATSRSARRLKRLGARRMFFSHNSRIWPLDSR